MLKRKKLCIIVLCIAVTMSTLSINAFAGTKDDAKEYKFDTVKELKKELVAKGKVARESKSIQRNIVENTDPEVLDAFIEEKTQDARDAMNAIDIDEVMEETADGNLYGKEVIDIGDGCQAIVEFEDCAEPTLLSRIGDYFIEPAFAATNGEVMWKDYGNRYFTAKSTVLFGATTRTFILENHYSLSSSGITERYGTPSAINATIGSVAITDSTATTPGSSDVNMYCRYTVSAAGLVSKTYKLETTVGYLAKDTGSSQIKVKHSWSVS